MRSGCAPSAQRRSSAKLTRTPGGLRWVRTGYAYQPPALGTYRRRRAACPQGPRTVRTGYTYQEPRALGTYRVLWQPRRRARGRAGCWPGCGGAAASRALGRAARDAAEAVTWPRRTANETATRTVRDGETAGAMCLARMADINGVGPRPRRLASRSQITSPLPATGTQSLHHVEAAPWAPQCSATRPLSVLYLPLHYWYGHMRLLGERAFCDSTVCLILTAALLVRSHAFIRGKGVL